MQIITSGSSYLDIDGYACCIAYEELLNLKGYRAIAVTSAPFNYSISKSILNLDKQIETPKSINLSSCAECVIMDVSDPKFFDPIVHGKTVSEIYDHHVGFEEFWHEKLGNNAKIEFIGCAATLIFEEWEKAGLTISMSRESAKILIAAILDNTLNFSASVTHQRDVSAKEKLCVLAGIGKNWCDNYFVECQQTIEHDLMISIKNDVKTNCNIPNLPQTIGQLSIWDAKKLLTKHNNIYSIMNSISESWMLNIISIKNSKSYFICNDINYQKKLENVFCVQFENDIAVAEKALLRKEIIKLAKNH